MPSYGARVLGAPSMSLSCRTELGGEGEGDKTARVYRQRTRVEKEAGGCPSLQLSGSVPWGR